jgi:protein-tyrosine phosphatase
MKSILVVCEGNICRSPMAEALLAAALPGTRVSSAGLHALVGSSADPAAVRLMRLRGIDITGHRATQINRDMCLRSELVLVMSTVQRKQIEDAYPTTSGRVFRLCEFNNKDVPDPYRQELNAFRESLQLIEYGIRYWVDRIKMI